MISRQYTFDQPARAHRPQEHGASVVNPGRSLFCGVPPPGSISSRVRFALARLRNISLARVFSGKRFCSGLGAVLALGCLAVATVIIFGGSDAYSVGHRVNFLQVISERQKGSDGHQSKAAALLSPVRVVTCRGSFSNPNNPRRRDDSPH